jgi:mono/diheme cytochrome c family protein
MQLVNSKKAAALAATMLLAGCCGFAVVNVDSATTQKQAGGKEVAVTPVEGESWLEHLNRPFDQTSMGKTGRLGPPSPAPGEPAARRLQASSSRFAPQAMTLHGSDLYRLDCRGCHGESGQGAPPEINSVINPVRATSVALVMERMKSTGMEISRADAGTLAQQANAALLQRLHKGGKNMPPFPQLSEAEIHSLVAFLNLQAGVPGAEGRQIAVTESPLRIGEHIVKSTCHTCHSAAGPDPTPQQIEDGAIPPLSVLTARKSQPEFIRKVTHGAPILMGTPPVFYRGRMPVFYYLSEQEAADVHLYLTTYPPSESVDRETVIALSHQDPAAGGRMTPPRAESSSVAPNTPLSERYEAAEGINLQTVILLSAVGSFVVLLLAGGLGFTIREFRRLSAETAGSHAIVHEAGGRGGVARPPGAMSRGAGPMSFGRAKR